MAISVVPFKNKKFTYLTVGLMALLTFIGAKASDGDDFQDKLMQLGSGPTTGSFSPIADTLCDTMNAERKTTLVRCISIKSAGSVFNIRAVANRSLQLGLGQEDLLSQAFSSAGFKGGNQLRTVALMHNSPIGIIVRKESGITDLSQIRKGIVNIGNKGAGYHANAISVIQAMNLKESDFAGVTYFPPSVFIKAFCEGKVDVIFNAIAHPSLQYQQLYDCGGTFLEIPSDIGKKMQLDNRWLRSMNIPAALYGPNQKEVKTLGMRNILFTNAEVDEEAIYRTTMLLNSKYKEIQDIQPNLKNMLLIEKSDLDQLSVPLHQGAFRALQMRAK